VKGQAGKIAEKLAAKYLEQHGLSIVARNVLFAFGEIDLIALDKKILVFVEVKYRRNLSYGFPYEAVGIKKRKKLIMAAKAFLLRQETSLPSCRFDVISLTGDLNNPVIEHIIDAFWDEGV
jgi:putative endonuclease